MTLVQNLEFRNKVLGLLVKLYQELPEPDYIAVAQCLVYLNDDAACAEMLNTLVRENTQTSLLTAYQIAFDLEDTATQDFLQKLLGGLPAGPSEALPSAAAATSADAMETDEKKEDVKAGDEAFADQFGKIRTILSGDLSIKLYLEFLFRTNKTDMLIIKNTKVSLM
jgi:26S proteasome regulatory subunit N2